MVIIAARKFMATTAQYLPFPSLRPSQSACLQPNLPRDDNHAVPSAIAATADVIMEAMTGCLILDGIQLDFKVERVDNNERFNHRFKASEHHKSEGCLLALRTNQF
jgi:hypothetical protein